MSSQNFCMTLLSSLNNVFFNCIFYKKNCISFILFKIQYKYNLKFELKCIDLKVIMKINIKNYE